MDLLGKRTPLPVGFGRLDSLCVRNKSCAEASYIKLMQATTPFRHSAFGHVLMWRLLKAFWAEHRQSQLFFNFALNLHFSLFIIFSIFERWINDLLINCSRFPTFLAVCGWVCLLFIKRKENEVSSGCYRTFLIFRLTAVQIAKDAEKCWTSVCVVEIDFHFYEYGKAV